MFGSYLNLGFEHILDPNGLDHVLFIIALSVPFLFKDWKKVVWLATAFTVGHSVTLALSALDFISIDSGLIEILIALSILLMALANILDVNSIHITGRYVGACFFGLIHGMGFSGFFKSILGTENIFLPLLAFNLGVELAQIVIVFLILAAGSLLIEKGGLNRKWWVLFLSIPVAVYSVFLIIERIW